MVKIKIVSVPKGEAPEWVRLQWLGLVPPVAEDVPLQELVQTGVLGGRPKITIGYPVPTEEAFQIVGQKNPRAAEWWRENISPFITPYLLFGAEACEVIP